MFLCSVNTKHGDQHIDNTSLNINEYVLLSGKFRCMRSVKRIVMVYRL